MSRWKTIYSVIITKRWIIHLNMTQWTHCLYSVISARRLVGCVFVCVCGQLTLLDPPASYFLSTFMTVSWRTSHGFGESQVLEKFIDCSALYLHWLQSSQVRATSDQQMLQVRILFPLEFTLVSDDSFCLFETHIFHHWSFELCLHVACLPWWSLDNVTCILLSLCSTSLMQTYWTQN